MPKPKMPAEQPIPFTDFERSRLIVQLRVEMLTDMAYVYRTAASNLNGIHVNPQREMCREIAYGFEQKAGMLKATLDMANKNR